MEGLTPLPQEPNPWLTHHTEVVFENPYVWIEHSPVTRPDGTPGTYSVIRFRRAAVGIIAIDATGHTYLVGQYRYPTSRYEWEIPEGGCEARETPLECAKRELREEVGLLATHWEQILHMQLSNSCTDEVSYTFLATGLTPTAPEPDATEKLQIVRLPLSEAFQRLYQGEIRDAISVSSLYKVQAMQQRGELKY
jgi:8-oxo-dGTP pyrophosphatase MutT (NUDIX family)